MNLQKAIAEGYKYCVVETEPEYLIELKDVLEDPEEYKGKDLFLCDLEPEIYTKSPEQLETLIQENIDEQEDYFMEDGFVNALDGTEDLIKALSEKINFNLSRHKFYMSSDEPLELEV